MRRLPTALATAVLLTGCGDAQESSVPVAGIAELTGPYRAEPYRAFDQSVLRTLEEDCSAVVPDGQHKVVLVDGRGGGRLLFVYDGPDGGTAGCLGAIEADGNIFVEDSGISDAGGPGLPGPREVRPMSGQGSGGARPWFYLQGRVGSEVSRVVIELADDAQITASIGDGWFAVWWPGFRRTFRRIRGYDEDGTLVADEAY